MAPNLRTNNIQLPAVFVAFCVRLLIFAVFGVDQDTYWYQIQDIVHGANLCPTAPKLQTVSQEEPFESKRETSILGYKCWASADSSRICSR